MGLVDGFGVQAFFVVPLTSSQQWLQLSVVDHSGWHDPGIKLFRTQVAAGHGSVAQAAAVVVCTLCNFSRLVIANVWVKQSRETNVEFGAVAIKQIPDLSQKLVLGPGLE